MKNKALPISLQYYKNNLESLSYNEAHKFLLKQIGLLMGLGWRYEDVLTIKELSQARELIVKKYDKYSYPYLRRLVDYVYTRDLAEHPFGPWIQLDPKDLLAFNDLAKNIINNNNLPISQILLAGYLFSFFVYPPLTKENISANKENLNDRLGKGSKKTDQNIKKLLKLLDDTEDAEIIRVSHPDDIYFIASVGYKTFHKYCELLGIKREYERWESNGENKIALWIKRDKIIQDDLQIIKYKNKDRYTSLINSVNLEDLVFLQSLTEERSLNTLKNNFEQRYVYTNKKFLANRPFPGFPFYRMDIFSNNRNIYIPFKLLNYKLLLAGLFGNFKYNKIQCKFNLLPNTLKNVSSDLSGLKNRLLDANLYTKYYPISTPQKPDELGKHFEQIQNVWKPITQLIRNGISISRAAANSLYEQIEVYKKMSHNSDAQEKLEKWISELESIIKFISIEEIQSKISGYFTPHASNTHRMTCSRFNLQGLLKDLKQEIFTSEKGWILLSADISGQDIAVAANLARKIYNDPIFSNDKNLEEIKHLQAKIDETINKLSQKNNLIAVPIDNITDNIINEKSEALSGLTRKEIRKHLKNIVYATFYGGSFRTLINEKKQDLDSLIKSLEVDATLMKKNKYRIPKKFDVNSVQSKMNKVNDLYVQISKDVWLDPERYYSEIDDEQENDIIAYEIKSTSIDGQEVKRIHFLNKVDLPETIKPKFQPNLTPKTSLNVKSNSDLDLTNRVIYQSPKNFEIRDIYDSISNLINEKYFVEKSIRQIEILNSRFLEYMNSEYAGILESLEFYEHYLVLNDKLTYPTLLGWQTMIDDQDQQYIKYAKTRSKSYVIQASGAEYVRQWILELTKVPGYQNAFRIVNVIHDQIMVEAKKEKRNFIANQLILTAKIAAEKVGLNPNTIHIPEIEEIG